MKARLVSADYRRVGFCEVTRLDPPPQFIVFEYSVYERSVLDETELLYRENPNAIVITEVTQS